MGHCVNHPEKETSYMCTKHGKYLCEQCLACPDPELYCKFRSACPIWFMQKGAGDLDRAEESPAEQRQNAGGSCRVTFAPNNVSVDMAAGDTLLEAARKADVYVNASCNGKGSCGKCKLILESGNVEAADTPLLSDREKEKNYVLACQSAVTGDVAVKIPEETIERKLKVAGMGEAVTEKLQGMVETISPMVEHVALELDPPTLDDPVSDLDRLKRGLKKSGMDTSRLSVGLKVMRELAAAMRDQNWQVTAMIMHKENADEVVAVTAGEQTPRSLGLAIDVGTTTIVVYLVDMADGKIVAATSGHNRQAACGDDIINRIVCAEKQGVRKLSTMALNTINALINEAVKSVDEDATHIDNVVVSGNTTMLHLLLKIEPRYIRREPYIPSISAFPILKGGNIGLKVNPNAACYIMPSPASYVGGDIVSGVLFTGFYRDEALTLYIDVGTNGEIVLGNRDWLITASCSAGPAFEGGGIRWGMRAEEGAIEKIEIDRENQTPHYSTIGDIAPRGICGSGMIELLSEMVMAGVINQQGKFQLDADHPQMTLCGDEPAYVLAFADETPMEEDLVFSETDIDNLLRSKGAVYAGFTVLLNQVGLDFSMIDQILITGGFGQYLDIEKSIDIGLLPDVDREKFKFLGNSSIGGAYLALLGSEKRKTAHEISNYMTYLDFSTNTGFMDQFTSALFLPHTNMENFPTVMEKMAEQVAN